MENNLPLDSENAEHVDGDLEQSTTYIDSERDSIIESLLANEIELQKSYQDFSLENELQNDKFCELLSLGVDMQDAYEICHKDDILQLRLEQGKKQWLGELKQSIKRPSEEAMQAGIQADSIYKMSKKQREALIKRVERGEIIKL